MLKFLLNFTLLFILTGFAQKTLAQRQGNIWYFGQKAGVDFNSGTPVALTDGQMDTDEGCATICDLKGRLLFYTDGVTVWDRKHQVMPNGTGLEGDSSSTQSAIIVPHPGDVNLFYIFTVDNNIGRGGLKYSIVDISLNGGNGAILSGKKNLLLLTPSTEKITAVQHKNGIDVWLIAHGWNSNSFYTYRIGAEGLDETPQIQNLGSLHKDPNRNAHGYMKASPKGNKLAVAIGSMGLCELFDFNDETGQLSNLVQLGGYSYVYGLEFSPDNSKLYLSFRYENAIHQFDISSGNANTILSSKKIIPTIFPVGALQLGIDGKIYATKNHTYLGVIERPNESGAEAFYRENGVFLAGRKNTLGLPSFVQSYFIPILFTFEKTCLGDTTFFAPIDTFNVDPTLVRWNFGDPSSGVRNTSKDLFTFHQFRSPGTYDVTLEVTYRNGVSKKATQKVVIQSTKPVANLGADTTLCPGTELVLDVSQEGELKYRWNGDTTLISPIFTIKEPGTYWVEIFSDCGLVTDTIQVDYYDGGTPLPLPKILCPGEKFPIDATMPNAVSYLWNDGSKNPTIEVNRRGLYQVKITTREGCEIIKSTYFEYLDSLNISINGENELCRGTIGTLSTGLDLDVFSHQNISFLWSNGSTKSEINIINSDTTSQEREELYWVVISIDDECAGFSPLEVKFLIEDVPYSRVPPINSVCRGSSIELDATIEEADTYNWYRINFELFQPPYNTLVGSGPKVTLSEQGLYMINIFNGTCASLDTFAVFYEYEPSPYLYAESFCPGDTEVTIYAYGGNYFSDEITYLWDDGSTEPYRTVYDTGTYSVTLTNSCGSSQDSITVKRITTPPPLVDLGKDTTLCAGQVLILDATQPVEPDEYFYNWGNNHYESTLKVSKSGIYRVSVDNRCVRDADDIKVTFIETPIAQFNDDEYICAGDSVRLSATNPNSTYLWKDSNKQVISTDSVIYVNEVGTYSVAISNECFTVEYETLILPFDQGVDLGADRVLCQGEREVLNVSIKDAIYTWQDGSHEPTLTAQTSGIYWVKVERGECVRTDTVEIIYLSDLEVNLGDTQYICNGEEITLRASHPTPQTIYRWYGDNGALISRDSVLHVNTPGRYRVEVENGCKTLSDEVEILPISLPFNLASEIFACKDEIVTLDVTVSGGSANYLWNTGSTDPVLRIDSSGVFSVRISSFDCEVNGTVKVTFLEEPLSIDLGTDVLLCPKETLTLRATTPNGHYQWQDGSTDSLYVVSQPGVYSVTVNNGCFTATDQITIQYNNEISLELGGDTTLCPGESLLLEANQSLTATYLWSDGSTSSSITVTNPDTVWVAVSAGECTVRDTIVVAFKPILEPVNLGRDTSICSYNTLILDATSSHPEARYRWQDGTTDSLLLVSAPGIYSVEVYNACDTVRDAIQVDFYSYPSVDFGADKILCPGETFLLDAINPQSTYLWHDGSTNPTFLVTQSQVAWVEVRSANGCISRDTIQIDFKQPLANVFLGNDTTLCPKTTMILRATSQNPEAQYRWQDGSTDSLFVVSKPGQYSVEVYTTCKTVLDEIQISYYDLPQVDLGDDALLCKGETLLLDATNPESTYLWQDGSTSATYLATETQTVWVEVRHRNGCALRDTIEIIYKPDLELNFGPDRELCEGEEWILNASNPYATYLWQDGTTESSYKVTQPGVYSVTVQNGCDTLSDEISIEYITLPRVYLGNDTLLCFGQSLLLTVQPEDGVSYVWQDDSQGTDFRVSQSGTYWVEANRKGCVIRDEIKILYVECLEDLNIPNVITPNGDYKNDYFVIDNLDLSEWVLTIYNRNGVKVYESSYYKNDWDGQNHSADVYFYSLIRKGSDLKVNGTITIIR